MTRHAAIAILAAIALGFVLGRTSWAATSRSAQESITFTAVPPVATPEQSEAPIRSGASFPPGPAAPTFEASASQAASTTEPAPATPGAVASKPGTSSKTFRAPTNPTPRPTNSYQSTTKLVAGQASWYCGNGSPCTSGYPASGLYAAAGPALRVGAWRGRVVRVNGVAVRLVDWCGCPGGRVVDLYASVFRQLAPLSAGTVSVRVTW